MLTVELIGFTANAEYLCGTAAAECYQGKNIAKSLSVAMDGGHESVLEHAAFTFRVSGVSRVLLAQLTRHRIASYSVQSQRYCGVKPEWVIPQTVKDAGYEKGMRVLCEDAYKIMEKMMEAGVPAEDARYIIPQGVTCSLVVTMNARELRHFFSLRCCNRAQWEIREMAMEMLEVCRIAAEKIFKDAGPGCVRGACPEGKKCCGKPWERVNG